MSNAVEFYFAYAKLGKADLARLVREARGLADIERIGVIYGRELADLDRAHRDGCARDAHERAKAEDRARRDAERDARIAAALARFTREELLAAADAKVPLVGFRRHPVCGQSQYNVPSSEEGKKNVYFKVWRSDGSSPLPDALEETLYAMSQWIAAGSPHAQSSNLVFARAALRSAADARAA